MGHGEFYRLDTQSADASAGGVPLKLYDDDGNERTLRSYERLVFCEVNVALESGAAPVDIYNDKDDDDTVDSGELLLRAQVSGEYDLANVASLIGQVPEVIAGGAGAIRITGPVYVQYGKTPSATPEWKSQFGQ